MFGARDRPTSVGLETQAQLEDSPPMRSAILSIPFVLCAASVAHADAKTCKAGALVFGDPNYVYKPGVAPNPAGQTVQQDPPLAWESLTFKGDTLYTSSNQEIWGGPASGAIKRLAGAEQSVASFAEGPCASARFGTIWGIALQRDGTLIVADHDANAILAVTDIDGPSCKVSVLVGSKKPQSTARNAPGGDTDGPAATAAISKPSWPVTDGSGNIYFIDGGAEKVKMIAADAAHTVSTIGQLKHGRDVEAHKGMTMLDDKLYTVTSTLANGVVEEVDPATKKVRVVKDGGAKEYPPMEQSRSPALSAITNDGNALLVFGRGYLWRMTKDGQLALLAGSGWELEFPKGYNPTGVYPANKLKLYYSFGMGLSGSNTYMTWNKNALYWRGKYNGAYVVKIDCQ
jgi:hypothetical protein